MSRKDQSNLSVNTVVDTKTTLSGSSSLGTFQIFANNYITSMENRYAPLILPAVLNQMPVDYSKSVKQFGGDDDYTAKQHVQWFKDYYELNEIDHEDVQMRLFA